ncbi:hypothetical protein GKC29_29365 [Micromonospora sp. WMMC415]|uniref:hypothetical protein n=1 Tax=Micromonospora sp. WMMC415 TaxID=2675222 RepID=UPI0012B4458F|nr:hypothetical protein [Micromonospora sp. WMMC415]QGN50529.1 hypothetical protein GKC29_29365 [Micromonospora sp. WMMC415]
MSSVRRALVRRVDHVWDLGWLNLIGLAAVAFFLLCASFPLRDGTDNLRAEKSGIGGTLTLTRCALDEWAKGDPWWCHGTFVSADDAVRITDVRYGFSFGDDPLAAGEPVTLDVRVAEPGSAEAWPPGDEWQPSLITGVFVLVLAGIVLAWWTNPGEEGAVSAPAGRRRPRSARRVRRWGGRRRRR